MKTTYKTLRYWAAGPRKMESYLKRMMKMMKMKRMVQPPYVTLTLLVEIHFGLLPPSTGC
jgi:hypothetical protein